MKKNNLNLGGGKKRPNSKQTPQDPQEAMDVAVSSLVAIASYLGSISKSLQAIENMKFELFRYEQEKGKQEGYLNDINIEEISKEGFEDDDEESDSL